MLVRSWSQDVKVSDGARPTHTPFVGLTHAARSIAYKDGFGLEEIFLRDIFVHFMTKVLDLSSPHGT